MKRKRIIIFLALFALALPSVDAQTSFIASGTPGNLQEYAIVRTWNAGKVVTYKPGYPGTIAVATSSGEQSVDLPGGITVLDMRVYGDIVYFCGTFKNSISGVLGYVDLNVLSGLSTTVTINYFMVNNATDLYRMVVYPNPVTPRIVAVGINRSIVTPDMRATSVVVDCPDISTSPSYQYRNANDIGAYSEQWRDIVYTGASVILVGHITSTVNEIVLRECDPYNPTYGIIDQMHCFPTNDIIVTDEIRATFLFGQNIAVVYRGADVPDVTDYSHFRVFDVGTWSNICSQEMIVPYKSYIHEMIFIPADKSVVLLQDFPSSIGPKSNFVYIDPLNNSNYSAPFTYYSDWVFHSVDRYDGSRYIGAGNGHWLLRDKTASFPAPSVLPPYQQCPSVSNIRITPIDNTPHVIFNFPQTPTNPPNTFSFPPCNIDIQYLVAECYIP